jgi:hypothetical protein
MSFHQDLDNLTRDMHDASWEVEYCQKNPVLALMLERKNLRFSGGSQYYKELDTDTDEDLVQDYDANTILTHGVKDTTERATFKKKKFQCPVQIDVDEELDNGKQSADGTQLHSLAKYRVEKANKACRFHMRKLLYRGTGVSGAATDSNKYVQGLNNALTVDHTYGGITRTYSAGTSADTGFFWQPMGGTITTTVQATETAISISWLRGVLEPLEDLESDNTSLITIVGGVLWLALQAEAEARSMPYTIEKNRVARQGFEEMIIDGRRIVKDPFLKAANNTAMGETSGSAGALERRIYCLNLLDWDLFIHPDRSFKLTEFFDQKNIAGGSDMKLARVLFAGNLVCWHPNSQLYYSNVIP